jgi:hypothetical protein
VDVELENVPVHSVDQLPSLPAGAMEMIRPVLSGLQTVDQFKLDMLRFKIPHLSPIKMQHRSKIAVMPNVRRIQEKNVWPSGLKQAYKDLEFGELFQLCDQSKFDFKFDLMHDGVLIQGGGLIEAKSSAMEAVPEKRLVQYLHDASGAKLLIFVVRKLPQQLFKRKYPRDSRARKGVRIDEADEMDEDEKEEEDEAEFFDDEEDKEKRYEISRELPDDILKYARDSGVNMYSAEFVEEPVGDNGDGGGSQKLVTRALAVSHPNPQRVVIMVYSNIRLVKS